MFSRRKFLKSAVGSVAAIPLANLLEAKESSPPNDRPNRFTHVNLQRDQHNEGPFDGLYLIQLGDDNKPATEQDILEAERIAFFNKDFGPILAQRCLDRNSALAMSFVPLRGPMCPCPPKSLYVGVGTPQRPATIPDAEDIRFCVEKALSNYQNERLYIITHHCVWITTDEQTPDVGQITMEFKCGCDGEKNPVWRFIGYRSMHGHACHVDRSCCDW